MPVSVNCPQCGKELVAPNELIGKVASCPQCNTPFPIAGGNGQNSQPAATPPPAATTAAFFPPIAAAGTAAPTPTEPRQPTPASAAPRPTPASPTQLPSQESYFPPSQDHPPGQSKPARFKSVASAPPATNAASAAPATPAAPSPHRAAQPARFVAAAQGSDTTIQLGQDGQLPTLVLDEGQASPDAKADGQQSNPLLLVAVLCFSLLSSLVMLFVEFEAGRLPDEDKRLARQALQQYYIQGQPLLEAYQHELRRALQAHNKGDYATERRHYQNVVRLLLAENNDDLRGLTGQARADRPPNDEHLREQLSILLRKD